jgi:hypothetical protein
MGGLIQHLLDGWVSILQYADDTIIFMKHDIQKALNMKLVLCIFEQLSGLKINFHNTEFFCFGRQNIWKSILKFSSIVKLGIYHLDT